MKKIEKLIKKALSETAFTRKFAVEVWHKTNDIEKVYALIKSRSQSIGIGDAQTAIYYIKKGYEEYKQGYKIEKTKNDEYSVKRRDGKSFKTNFTVLPVHSMEFASLNDAVLFLRKLTLY